MSTDHKLAVAAAVSRNLENTLEPKAAEFCQHYGLDVKFELPLGLFAAEMVRYGIRLAQASNRLLHGEPGCEAAA